MNKLAVPLALIALGFVGLMTVGILEGGIPEIQVRDVRTEAYAGKVVKVHGLLDKIESRDRPLRFTVRDKDRPDIVLPVYADKTRPDTFQETYDVAVEGRWDDAQQRFIADKIMTKCPSKYEAEAKEGIGSKEELERRKGPSAPRKDARGSGK